MSLSLYSPRLFSELAQLYTVQGRYDEAESIYIDALNMLRDTLPKNSWCVGRCLSQLGQLAKLRNQDDKAEATYVCACVRVRAYKRACECERVVQWAGCVCLCALLPHAPLRLALPRSLVAALTILRRSNKNHLVTATALNELAELYVMQRRVEPAEPLFRESLRVRKLAIQQQNIPSATASTSAGAVDNGFEVSTLAREELEIMCVGITCFLLCDA